MGQSSSQQLGQRSGRSASVGGTPSRMRFRSPFMRRKRHKTPLSAAFVAPHMGSLEALNINTATVEQLMTLPGVNRRVAQCIVDHRAAIGGQFQRIDDLALVSGMGAVKLEQIRPEICVRRKQGSLQGSSLSSRTPSVESLLSEPALPARPGPLNINTATVFQLQQVSGLNQELAANVVEYRKRKGPFKSLDDLGRVKGLSPARVGAIRALLSLSDDEATPKTPRLHRHASTVSSGGATPVRNGGLRPSLAPNRKSLSVSAIRMNGTPLTGLNGFRNVPVNDIYDLLGAYSHRPTVEGEFQFSRGGRRAIRIASWNLDRLTKAKAENPGVLEVVCRTILENKLSIICLQEVLHGSALARICEELNHPSLRRTIEWRENSRQWKFQTSGRESLLSGLGFLYDAAQCDFLEAESRALDLKGCLEGSFDGVPPAAHLATFRLSTWCVSVLNIYLKHFSLARIDAVLSAVAAQRGHQEVFLVAGDFSGVRPRAREGWPGWEAGAKGADARLGMTVDVEDTKYYKMLDVKTTSFDADAQEASQCNILCRESLPVHRNAFREAIYKSKSLFDKELLAKVPPVRAGTSDRLTGHAAVVRQGLCHMAIPRGWTWGGPASEFCPVFVELFQDAGGHANGDASDLNSSSDSVFAAPK
ncbi:endonuclease/exonuclease/phosphatase family domain-containing protein 1-like [Phlebotomus argentipes]|uniref:endonuclease/exonuclease/phosphatase family domain-containing protein 1-like n=1 Tax=Phlebotomus argentipes TaxID=94469 RepID=UPI0028936116|nr:endonuclease/exonuclease/phosphatase family domain-containing protein 1-like [Phlebotomus argentipes]